MAINKAIKVIKRSERNAQQTAAEAEEKGRESGQAAAREIVATVTGWVNEFQQKRRTKTTRAFQNLFTDSAPKPSEI